MEDSSLKRTFRDARQPCKNVTRMGVAKSVASPEPDIRRGLQGENAIERPLYIICSL